MASSSDWMANVEKSKQTRATRTAAKWNMPGGGYDQWKKGDAERERQLPIGSTITPIKASSGERQVAKRPVSTTKPKVGY